MKVIETKLPGALLIKPKVFGDARGYFQETFSVVRYAEHGISEDFVQDNHSHSSKGVLRGLHYQLRHPQGKLVTVMRGEVFDVAVDIRYGSATFGQWFGATLSDTNHHQMYIPPGFAHGFVVLSEEVDFIYKCTDYYHPEDERGLMWNDPAIGIEWPMVNEGVLQPVLSEKDQRNPSLAELRQQGELPKP